MQVQLIMMFIVGALTLHRKEHSSFVSSFVSSLVRSFVREGRRNETTG